MNALAWLAEQGFPVKCVEPLAGLTACSRLIELEDGQKFVWREQSRQATDYGVNYAQEFALLSALSFLPFTPKPYFGGGNFSLLHWQAGSVPTEWRDDLLKRLAENLATLHRLDWQAVDLPRNIAKLDLAERCQFLWDKLPQSYQVALHFQPPFEPILPFATAICHHDLHLGNLVESEEQLIIIDWEYASLSDPALEIALFLHANALSSAQKALFFEHYFAKSGLDRTACLAKVAEYQPLVAQLSMLWFALNSANSAEK